MIKPLNNVSSLSFGNGFENYQQQIKANVKPEYNLTITPGSDVPINNNNKKGFKQSIVDAFKGVNSTTSVLIGGIKGLVEGIALGSIFGVFAKHIKENTGKIKSETGDIITQTNTTKAIMDSAKDIFRFAGKVVKSGIDAVVKRFDKIKEIPGKYFDYIGKDSKAIKASVIGIVVLATAISMIKAKIEANKRNADIDHSLNISH